MAPPGVADAIHADAGAHAVAAALLAAGNEDLPLLLVLEDVHWADEATLDVLRVLGRRVRRQRDAGDRHLPRRRARADHPLRVLLGDLATADGVRRLHVEPLSAVAVAQMAEGRAVDPAALYRLTSGNPFYVTEALAAGGQEVPPTVRDAVFARIASSALTRPPSSRPCPSHRPRSMPRSILAVWARHPTRSTSASHRGYCTRTTAASPSATSSRAWPSRSRSRRPGALRCTGPCSSRSPTRRARTPTSHASRITRKRRRTARPSFASPPRRPSSAGGSVRIARRPPSMRVRSASRATSPRRSRRLLEGSSRACYLADDQIAAIAVIQEAIPCRQARARRSKRRARSPSSPLPRVPGVQRRGERGGGPASQLAAGPPEARAAYVFHTQALEALGRGDVEASLELAGVRSRSARVSATRRSRSCARHHRVAATARSDLEDGPRHARGGRRVGATAWRARVAARGMNVLVFRASRGTATTSSSVHRRRDRVLHRAHVRISGGSTFSRCRPLGARPGRWTKRRGPRRGAGRSTRVALDAPRGVVRPRPRARAAGRSGRARRAGRAAAVGVPRERSSRTSISRLRVPRSPGSSAPGTSTSRPQRCWRASSWAPNSRFAPPVLAPARRSRRRHPRDGSGRTRCASPATGRRRRTRGRRRAPYEAALALAQTDDAEALRPMPSACASAPGRSRPSWRESSGSPAPATSRAARAARGRTRRS